VDDLSRCAELLQPQRVSDGRDSHASMGDGQEEPAWCVILLIGVSLFPLVPLIIFFCRGYRLMG